MHAEKRQGWVRHRIDQALDETAPLRSHSIILPTEGDDLEIEARASHARQMISKQPPTVNQELCVNCRSACLNHQPAICVHDLLHARAGPDLPSAVLHELGVGAGYAGEVNNPGGGNVQSLEPSGIGFDFPQSFGADHFQPH